MSGKPRKSGDTEILLGGNRRVGLLLVLAAAVGLLIAIVLCATVHRIIVWSVASVLAAAGGWMLITGLYLFRPRVAYRAGELFVHLRPGAPLGVPIEFVEVFFIGQGAVAGDEPGHPAGYLGAVAANVVVRLAERATDWKSRDVDRRLGIWRDGYITIRGMWCEEINANVLARMNRRLRELRRGLQADDPAMASRRHEATH